MLDLQKLKLFLHDAINDLWYQKPSIFTVALYPLSAITFLVLAIRRLVLQQIYKTPNTKALVLVVGNITVGGSGKTPLTIHVAKYLEEQGYKVGIILRGYKAALGKNYPVLVNDEHLVEEIGDEAALYRKAGLKVAIGANRKAAAKLIDSQHDLDIIISDDGLQHYKMYRDIEILAVDSRGFGNYLALPLGPLREWPLRKHSADIILNKSQRRKDGYLFKLENDGLYSMSDEQMKLLLSSIAGAKVHAVAGVANPEPFFKYIESLDTRIRRHRFPDHHNYTAEDFPFASEPIVMTEKDAVKCQGIKFAECYISKVKVQIDNSFYGELLNLIQEKIHARYETSRHLSMPNL